MCKYCEMKPIGGVGEEMENIYHPIIDASEGRFEFDLYFRRYESGLDGEGRANYLIMEWGINNDGEFTPVVQKDIDIKYCPFCGEKL